MVFVSNWPFVLMLVALWTTHFANAESEYSLSSNSKWQPIKPSEVARMYNNSFMSDTKFTFGTNKLGEVFYAHKYVLAFSSPLFYEMFYSNNIEKPIKAIHLSNHNNETIAGFFGFIYKNECPTDFEVEVLRLVMKYKIVLFDSACSHTMGIESQKVFKLVENILELNAEAFTEICLGTIDGLADEYFASEYFLNIKQSTLDILLNRNTLYYNETDLFKAVLKWADHQCSKHDVERTREHRRKILGNAIYSIRFLLMNQSEFTTHVMPTNILYDNETVAIMKAMAGKKVPNLAWDLVKLRSKRLPEILFDEKNKVTATSKGGISWRYYFAALFFIISCTIFYQLAQEKQKRQRERDVNWSEVLAYSGALVGAAGLALWQSRKKRQ
ncbi:BTB POZ domain-containing 6-like [Paramuricea clavata]|uniref:BTB POZ domain-containing 6-like n=1 Tax=Paramuricea clavata TaxID=317549 RepID=A0A7D9LSY0_PARCT|nr:BTB POZ domain-containing 6-like [Paramuricea clavata]